MEAAMDLKNKILQISLACLIAIVSVSVCFAEAIYTLTIKDHQFTPAELAVPANQQFKLIVENQDITPEEFESHDLNREKIVTGNGKITLNIGPLAPGQYHYVGEFHEDTAKGIIVASE